MYSSCWPHRISVGTSSAASFALVGLELVELEGAIELEHPRRPSAVENIFQYSSSARSSNSLEASPSNVANASRERLSTSASPWIGVRIVFAISIHPWSGKNRCGDHQARHGVRVIACPAQADQTAGVVHDKHHPVEPDLAAEASTASTWRRRSRRIGRRVAEAGRSGASTLCPADASAGSR